MSHTFNGDPEDFYEKIIKIDGFQYVLQENKIFDYVNKHASHSEFIIITFIGKSQMGKSNLIQDLSNVKHKIGNKRKAQTEGATIAYGGTIKEIYQRMNLTPPNDRFCERDVFFCDTEGVYDETKKGSIAALIMPLLILSSKIVAVLPINPDNSITNFLSICKSFIKVSDGKVDDPFKNKLIVRVLDYPEYIEEENSPNIGHYIHEIENDSDVSQYFKAQSISPIYAPAGPWDPKKKTRVPEYTKNLLDLMFANQENSIAFSSPRKFVDDVKMVTESPMADCARIMVIFKEKNLAQRLLDFICIQIEVKINDYFDNFDLNSKLNEGLLQEFFQNEVVNEITNVSKKNNIQQKYLNEYLQLEKQFFDRKKKELQIRISNYEKCKIQISQAKNKKEKVINDLKYISETVQQRDQSAADFIFYNVENRFVKIEKYQDVIINQINSQRTNCIHCLRHFNISYKDLQDGINSDINSIFDKLLDFKNFTFYREHGLFSRVISYFVDSVEESDEADEIGPDLWGVINTNNEKYCRIIVGDRKYNEKFAGLVNTLIENKIMSKLTEMQKERVRNFVQEHNIKYVSDLTYEQIDSLTKDHRFSG